MTALPLLCHCWPATFMGASTLLSFLSANLPGLTMLPQCCPYSSILKLLQLTSVCQPQSFCLSLQVNMIRKRTFDLRINPRLKPLDFSEFQVSRSCLGCRHTTGILPFTLFASNFKSYQKPITFCSKQFPTKLYVF